jgi:hypothetical protein
MIGTNQGHDGLSCFRWIGKHKLDPNNAHERNQKILDHMCGFCNLLCPADKNGEVAPSSCLDVAVSENNGQKERSKKDQKQVLMQAVISKLSQKERMRLGMQRLTAIGVMKSQSLILDGDHLDSSLRREAEFVKVVKEIGEKQQ